MNHKSIIPYFAILGVIGLSITAQAQTEFAPVGATWEYDFEGESEIGTELIKVADTLSLERMRMIQLRQATTYLNCTT